METSLFLLDPTPANKFTKTIRILFGIVCIILGFSWLIININKGNVTRESLVPIIFIFLFGIYQIFSGLGKTTKFIRVDRDIIECKQHAILPARTISPLEINKIVIFPLSVQFNYHNNKRFIFRFGTSYREIMEPVKDAIETFANKNEINMEYGIEDLN